MGPLGIRGRNSLPATRSATRICGRRAHERLRAMRAPSVQAGSGHARANYASGFRPCACQRSNAAPIDIRRWPRTQTATTHASANPPAARPIRPASSLRSPEGKAAGKTASHSKRALALPAPWSKRPCWGEFLTPFAYYFAPFAAIGRKGPCGQ